MCRWCKRWCKPCWKWRWAECLQAGKHERNDQRLGYRSGYYRRRLLTRVGTIVLRVPQDRAGRFSRQVFEQYQRSEKALVAALAQMYVQGVSTRKVAAITQELCGHEFSASSISMITARLETQLEQFSRRRLAEEFSYVVLDARYERVREGGVIVSRAILVALGIGWQGRRQVLAVECANRESQSSGREFLLQLKERGLTGVKFVVSDGHPGLKAAIREVLPAAWWQRCYVHFLRNTLDHLPRQADDDCLPELRWMYERRDVEEARRDLRQWLEKWSNKYPKLCAWVEGGGQPRGDVDVLSAAGGAPQAPEEHEPVGTVQPGEQAADAGGADLSGRGELPAVDPRGGGGAARGVAGRQPLPQCGAAAGSVSDNKSDDEASRMSSAGGAAS